MISVLEGSGGKSNQVTNFYLTKCNNTLTENDSSKCESHPVKYYLSKSLELFAFEFS